jgi:hypothetical protein
MLGNGFVVRELIEIKPGLLRLHQINGRSQARYLDLRFPWRFPEQHTDLRLHSFRPPDWSIVPLNNRLQAGRVACRLQCLDDQRLPLVHPQRQRLQDEVVPISIHDHARQTVALAPDHATQTRVHPAPRAILHRLRDAALKKIEIEFLPSPRKASGHDLRFAVIDRAADQPVFPILQ